MAEKTLKDTIDDMLSDDWKDRLVAEIEQVDIRLTGLDKRLETLDKDDPEYSLLESQQVHMVDYMMDLMARANCHGIKCTLPRFVSNNTSPETDSDPRFDEFMKFVSEAPPIGNPETYQ